MEKSGPILKLEKVVIEALKSRGFSQGEAETAVTRLESLADKPQTEQPKAQREYQQQSDTGEYGEWKGFKWQRNSSYGKYKVVSNVVCTVETPDAIFIKVAGKGAWIPKSQLARDSQVKHKGDAGDLKITEWLYNRRTWR